jgi:hypothetical protein
MLEAQLALVRHCRLKDAPDGAAFLLLLLLHVKQKMWHCRTPHPDPALSCTLDAHGCLLLLLRCCQVCAPI